MKKMSLQWRLTCITTLCIAIICGCLTMFVYKNGVYYMDSLQKAVDAQGDDSGGGSEEIYISIPEDKWDEFSNDFSVQVYNNKEDYKRNSLIVSALLALLGGVAAYFISGHALKPIREFSDKIEEVQAQNLADSGIEECKIKELNQLSVSYNKMLERLSDAFEIQRQFTASAAHELRTPLSLMQVQLDLYHSTQHPGSDADMILREGDRLIVPQYNGTVKINGSVMYANTVAYEKGKSIASYIDEAGGFASDANKSKAYIIYMNGKVAKVGHGAKAQPGCEIVVPSKMKRKMTVAETMSMGSSLSSIAAMIATIANLSK